MTGELDAAGIKEPRLREAYARCRQLNAEHGKTYFLATRMLAPAQRPAVHALYGFARFADDVVDVPPAGATPADVAASLEQVAQALGHGLDDGRSQDPIIAAVVDCAGRFGIGRDLFDDFLTSMRMDLTVERYPTRADLYRYTRGSAEVIGLQVLPVLGTVTSRAEAAPAAAALGLAFQLTNFLRDVAEDYERGRVYLPLDELAAHGVDDELIGWCVANRRTEPRMTEALRAQIAATRAVYAQARPGIAMLSPISRPCVRTAYVLYSEILDRIEAAGHDVFSRRAHVHGFRKATVAGAALAKGIVARRLYRGSPAGAR
ncbi:Phytoene synthase [Kribbella flavida DSM 17836]|uniref:Phytoene synthase n=1 Tax=Kribbella flavida (strain DSM 17836 / JCM 10339 / NBRC 14399) TaxID=479435 RepID=D2PPZ1_KRIFD|nr:phytoene/squalene synthase family protein [Kribbella flavida]ADB32915.1 Phytoene synthase [Kribbella flavida DSM 17836]